MISATSRFVSWLPLRLLLLLLFLGPARSFEDYHSVDSVPPIQDVVVGAPVTVRRLSGSFIETSPGVKPGELVSCIRLRIPGVTRLKNVWKYADSFRAKVEALTTNYNKLKIDVCFHGNKSLELGRCSKDIWKSLEKGCWNGMMSPFETRFLDIRMRESLTDTPLTVSVEEEFWPYRLFFLGFGLMLLLVAPVVSGWVPFYYSSAMTLGIFLVVLILLFQGMKLLPTGRKSTLYIVLYGSVVGMGTVILSYFTGMVSSILKEFGFSNETYNPVAIFLLVGVVLMGAWLGYWGVRKLVLSEDGTVDIGTSQFVKWAIRVVGAVMILQSSHDPLLALLALVIGVSLTWAIRKLQLQDLLDLWDTLLSLWPEHFSFGSLYGIPSKRGRTAYMNYTKAEFLHKGDTMLLKSHANSLHRTPPVASPRTLQGTLPASSYQSSSSTQQDFYSSFHKTPTRKQINKAEWDVLTQEYTKKAINNLAASPEFANWFVNNTERIMIVPNENREERSEEEIQMTANLVQGDEGEGNGRRQVFGR